MTKSPTNTPQLSIIILYYNSGPYLDQCLSSLAQSQLDPYRLETIIVNNGAADGVVKKAQKKFAHHPILNPKFIYSAKNLGFSAGNNFGLKHLHPKSTYVLFVNDDIKFFPTTIYKLLNFVTTHPQVDATTIKVVLASTGQMAPETHRGFPTPWNTFWHFFGLGIPRLFPKSPFFHGYLNDHKDYKSTQIIECCQGCFLLLKRSVGQAIGWWNEKYFFLGEDLDLCYQLRQKGFNLYLYPHTKVIHYHGISSGLQKTKSSASRDTRIRSAIASTNAMRTFYQQNLMSQYPQPLHWLILLGIKILEVYRIFKAKYL